MHLSLMYYSCVVRCTQSLRCFEYSCLWEVWIEYGKLFCRNFPPITTSSSSIQLVTHRCDRLLHISAWFCFCCSQASVFCRALSLACDDLFAVSFGKRVQITASELRRADMKKSRFVFAKPRAAVVVSRSRSQVPFFGKINECFWQK